MTSTTLREVTIPMLREWGACYFLPKSPHNVERLFAGRASLTLHDVLGLDIPARDKLWVLLRCARHKDLIELYRWCRAASYLEIPMLYGVFVNVHSTYGTALRTASKLAERNHEDHVFADYIPEDHELMGLVRLLHQIMVAP